VTTPRSAPRPAPGATPLPHGLHQAAPDTAALESALDVVELHIAALGRALAAQDPAATEAAGGELRTAMRGAMSHFAQVQRAGVMPPAIRHRLAMASGQIAAQREALFRATTALDQALDILLPRPEASAGYSAYGTSAARSTGRVIAAT
jgi:hypothetical protein